MKTKTKMRPKGGAPRPDIASKVTLREAATPRFTFTGTALRQTTVIFLLAVALFANTLAFDYNLDDGVVISGNKYTQRGLAGIPDIVSHDLFAGYFGEGQLLEHSRYRPLTQILFAIQYQFFGPNPFIGHLTNVLVYALTCALLFQLLNGLIKPRNSSFLSASFVAVALFTTHPLHTEVVANIKGLDEIASLLITLATLWLALRYVGSGQKSTLYWIALMFLAAMLSKESSVTFLAVIPLALYVFTDARKKHYLSVLAALLAGFVTYMAMRYGALGVITAGGAAAKDLMNNPFLGVATAEKYATILHTWGKYLLLLIFPHPLTHDYYPKQIPIVGWTNPLTIVAVVVYGLLAVCGVIAARRKDVRGFGVLFFLLTFSVSSNLIVPLGTFMNERFMFVPLLGLCMAGSYLLLETLPSKMGETATYRIALSALVGLVLLAYSVKTITRNPAWKDGYTLFTTDVKVSTNSAKVNISAGGLILERMVRESNAAVRADQAKQAAEYLRRAVAVYPQSLPAWSLLARAELELNDLPKAAEAAEHGLRINPSETKTLNYLLVVAQRNLELQKYAEAIATYMTLIKYQPQRSDFSLSLAAAYEAAGQIDRTAAVLNEITVKDPSYAPAYNRLGEIYGKYYNDVDRALSYHSKAHSLNSQDASTLQNLGVIYGMKKDYQESLNYFSKAVEARPNDPQLRRNIATVYRTLGMNDKMNEALAKAAQLEANK